MSEQNYKPDYLVSPDEVVKDYLIDKYHYDQSSSMALELASMELDIVENELKEIVWCSGMITPVIATKLEKLGRPAHFWLNLERQYQEDRARLSGISEFQVDKTSWFYKNCKRQRRNGAKICSECPFRKSIERGEE